MNAAQDSINYRLRELREFGVPERVFVDTGSAQIGGLPEDIVAAVSRGRIDSLGSGAIQVLFNLDSTTFDFYSDLQTPQEKQRGRRYRAEQAIFQIIEAELGLEPGYFRYNPRNPKHTHQFGTIRLSGLLIPNPELSRNHVFYVPSLESIQLFEEYKRGGILEKILK